jgi:N-acyl-D-aspartate/D-glutamate deacylase
VIEGGNDPDMMIFNPDTIKDKATVEKPHQYPSGIDYVIVKGQLAISNGAWTGIKAGQVLDSGRK